MMKIIFYVTFTSGEKESKTTTRILEKTSTESIEDFIARTVDIIQNFPTNSSFKISYKYKIENVSIDQKINKQTKKNIKRQFIIDFFKRLCVLNTTATFELGKDLQRIINHLFEVKTKERKVFKENYKKVLKPFFTKNAPYYFTINEDQELNVAGDIQRLLIDRSCLDCGYCDIDPADESPVCVCGDSDWCTEWVDEYTPCCEYWESKEN